MPSGSNLVTHGGYRDSRLAREGKLDGRTKQGKKFTRIRDALVLGVGYPSYASSPATVQLAVTNATRLALLAESLFGPFYTGETVPEKFLSTSTALQRQLSALGLHPHAPLPDTPSLDAIRQRYTKEQSR